MHDETTAYISNLAWVELLQALNADEALRLKLGVKLCPFSGVVEEYMLADRLGGQHDTWPAKWRNVIEAGRAEMMADAA